LPSQPTPNAPITIATLLTKRWYDRSGKLGLEFWVRHAGGAGRVLIENERAVFFVDREQEVVGGSRKPLGLVSMAGKPVDAVYFPSQQQLTSARQRLLDRGYLPFESDIRPCDRFLMERFVTGAMKIIGEPTQRDGFTEWRNPRISSAESGPGLTRLSLDIETEGLGERVISIAGTFGEESVVFIDTAAQDASFVSCDGEDATIAAFERWVAKKDPDLLMGWNVVEFDLKVLCDRAAHHGRKLRLGRGTGRTDVRESRARSIAYVDGRMVLDGISTLRSSGYMSPSFSLQDISQALLGEGKAIAAPTPGTEADPAAEIMRMYREDPSALAVYNLQDCVLVEQIFEKQDLVGFVLERQALTGLAMDRQGGSVAAFDYLYLPRLHRQGRVARTIDSDSPGAASPGGYVLAATPGLFKNVLVLDFKSLYPSIIRTFNVDPLALVTETDDGIPGFKGATFHRTQHILPELLRELWAARDQAKARGDKPRSSAIKVLMNSFYGVLGTTGCRFFDPKLASSITMRGHELILESKSMLEAWGVEVVYGDTDSLFVRVGDALSPAECRALGDKFARDVNTHFTQKFAHDYRIESHLEMEFEVHYHQLYLPTKRGSTEGSKKRYAGQVEDRSGEKSIVYKGLEVVRTDWTTLARQFQRELFERTFAGQTKDLGAWIRAEVAAVRAGERDDLLVYSKRLRRPPSEYRKNVPPHVKAALIQGGAPRRIHYVITVSGPQPVSQQTAGLDYEHYVDKQLEPAAEGLLQMLGMDFGSFSSLQGRLF
jgi:DNA polymerase-2